MSRKGLSGLASPVPLGTLLPAIYQEHDPNMMLLTEIVDELLAPIWLTLDSFTAYLDPDLTPTDFLDMLASWVGLSLDPNWSWERRRAVVKTAVEAFQWEGTKRGIAAEVEAYCGIRPWVTDSGGVTWSATPGATAPGAREPAVRVHLDIPPGVTIDIERLRRLVERRVPAHVPVTVDSSPA